MAFSTTPNLYRSALLPCAKFGRSKQLSRRSLNTGFAYNDTVTPRKGQAVTCGLELESNIAFTEQTLVSILDGHSINFTHVQKEHSDSAHSNLLAAEDYSKTCRSRYPSLGVAIPLDAEDPYTSPFLTSAVYNTACEQTDQPLRVRSYISEPLLLAQSLMKQHDLQADVRAVIRKLGIDQPNIPLPGSTSSSDYLLCRSADYSKWTLTNDHTLIGSLKSQLMQHLPCKVTASNVDDWNSHGIELVSPVFQLSQKEQAIADLSSRLASLPSPSADVLPSTWAGLHVHIGFDVYKPGDLNLRTLQNLAYVLVIHEDVITSLFPSHCSGTEPTSSEPEEPEDPDDEMSYEELEKAWALEEAALEAAEERSESSAESSFTDAATSPTSARTYAEQTDFQKDADNEAQVLAAESTFTNHQNKLSNARYLATLIGLQQPAQPAAIAEAIFSTTSIPELVHLLQKPRNDKDPAGEVYRGYMYNFSNLLNVYQHGTGQPTVEFRQHECCIDAKKVGRWVRLVEAVVRKVEEMAAEDERYSYMSPIKEVAGFCAWISLDVSDTGYWLERHGNFSKEKKEGMSIELYRNANKPRSRRESL